MADINPFAAPQEEVVAQALLAEPGGGVWRDGRLLVMQKQAVLPDRCVKCNQPAGGGRLTRKLSWHHPGFFLLILAGLWIYLIVVLIMRHTAKIEIGICELHRRKRRNAILASWLIVLAGIAALVIGTVASSDMGGPTPDYVPALFLGGLLAFLGGLIYAAIAVPPVAPNKIDKDYVWLRKVHPSYLAELPEMVS